MSKKKGILFVITGPSGVGKGTILRKVFDSDRNIVFSVSATTRKPREGERHGEDYFFVDEEEFITMIDEDMFLEWAFVHGNYYGTPADFVDEKTGAGNDVILDIDVQGGLSVKSQRPGSVFVFIAPPNMNAQILEERLRKRNTEHDDHIEDRVKTANEEMKLAGEYRYIIFNDKLDEAVGDLEAIIRAERCRTKRQLETL